MFINPSDIRITQHACERYIERVEGKTIITTSDISRAKNDIKKILDEVSNQKPSLWGRQSSRRYFYHDICLVVSKDYQHLTTIYKI